MFLEVGTKVTEKDMVDKKEEVKNLLKMDEMKMYLFPNDFYYPIVQQTSSGQGTTELDVGTISTLSYDDNLRSMLRYALIDLNKGDVRSGISESKRSLYMEYDVKEGEKTVTKYVWCFTMGNPLLIGIDKSSRKGMYDLGFYNDAAREKKRIYGRDGTFVSLMSSHAVDKTVARGDSNTTYMKGFLCDFGFPMSTSGSRIDSRDNMLLNPFRCNWGWIASAGITFFLYYGAPQLRDVLLDRRVFDLYYGQLVSKSGEKYVDDIGSVIVFAKPSFSNSFYGDDFVLKLMCSHAESSVVGASKRQKIERLVALLYPNDNTYQQFLGQDNKVSIQPPTFRPLSLMTPETTRLIGSGSKRLRFEIRNMKNEAVTFGADDAVVMELEFTAEGDFK